MHGAAILLLSVAAQQTFTTNNYPYDGAMTRPPGSALVWSDEFDGAELDAEKWTYDTAFNKQGWFNKERQYYSANRSKNLRLENGRLIIEARYEPLGLRKYPDWGGQQYSSARIYSK